MYVYIYIQILAPNKYEKMRIARIFLIRTSYICVYIYIYSENSRPCNFYLVILRRSKKLGDPWRLGIEGDRDLDILLEVLDEVPERELDLLLDLEIERDDLLELDEEVLLCVERRLELKCYCDIR